MSISEQQQPAPPAGGNAPTDLAISVVLPGYNEEDNIEDTVGKCLEALKSFTDRPEIIVINDCSKDRTGEIAERLQREHPAVRVIHNPINLGVGTSLLIGMNAASGDIVMHNMMDYVFDMRDLDKVMPLFAEADVVYCVRYDRSAHPLWRKITSLVHYWLIRLLFRVPFGDMNFTQMYKRSVFRSLPVKARSPTFVTAELLIRAHDQGFRIAYARAPFLPRFKGQANYGKPRDILWALADIWSFWLERLAGKS